MSDPIEYEEAELAKENEQRGIVKMVPHTRAHELTAYDIAALATRIDKEHLEAAVEAVPAELLPQYLYLRDRAVTLLNALGKAITTRMVTEQRLGERWTAPDGTAYVFENERRSKWTDLGGLFYALSRMGVSVTDLGNSVSEARVTDLRAAVQRDAAEKEREDALATIEAHREWRDGTPKLAPVDSPYRTKKAKGNT